mgnify:CR=1 FL=1
MKSRTGSVIVISYSDKFSLYLDGLMISNSHFKNLTEFNDTYSNYPLTTKKVIVFESGILDIDSIKVFSDIVLDELAQVEEILFVVEEGFREYFEVSLSNFHNKRFLSTEITYKSLEEVVTGNKSYQLKTEMEVVDVVQRKRKEKKKSKEIGRFQTRVTIDRKTPNSKIDQEPLLLDKEVTIQATPIPPNDEKEGFTYQHKQPPKRYISNNVLLYDVGFNTYNLIKSSYSEGRRVLFIDHTDSLLLSFFIEHDESLPPTPLLKDIYSEGVHMESIKNYFKDNDLCVVRNSYALKKTLSVSDMDNLIKFVVGRFGRTFDVVYIVTDDFKVTWENALRYVFLPSTMDNLMRMVNYAEREKTESNRLTYVKLEPPLPHSEFNIDEVTARAYFDNQGLTGVKIIKGRVDKNDLERTYLFDVLRLESGVNTEDIDKWNRNKAKRGKGAKR